MGSRSTRSTRRSVESAVGHRSRLWAACMARASGATVHDMLVPRDGVLCLHGRALCGWLRFGRCLSVAGAGACVEAVAFGRSVALWRGTQREHIDYLHLFNARERACHTIVKSTRKVKTISRRLCRVWMCDVALVKAQSITAHSPSMAWQWLRGHRITTETVWSCDMRQLEEGDLRAAPPLAARGDRALAP